MNTLTVGDNAPLFTLQNENDEPISLADYIGKKTSISLFLSKSNDTWLHSSSTRLT
jgi:peroxiredoxin Q/BCP